MKLAGSYKLNVKKEIVWNALNDPKILKQCIPGCDSFIKENDKKIFGLGRQEKQTKKKGTSHIAPLNLIADGMHNFLDGLIIAGSYLVSIPAGIATTIAVILHEVPQEIADFGVLLYSGFSKKKALLLNFLSAAVAIVGAIAGLSIGNSSEEFILYLLPFAAGGFIYIAGSNLNPELHKEYNLKDSLLHLFALVLGIGIMVSLLFLG